MRTLYGRLLGTLLVILVVVGGLVSWASVRNAQQYRMEVTQKLHLGLAESLVAESLLMSGGMIYAEAVEDVFHTLMVINPAIEVYLVDAEGTLLRYSAPEGKVKLDRLPLDPIQRFLAAQRVSSRSLPILGPDPRNPEHEKVFSVAPIVEHGSIQGYLYVILESEEYAAAAESLWSSSALRLGATGLAATLLFALSAGGLLFRHLTKRLRALDGAVERFRDGPLEAPIRLPDASDREHDELDRLATSFEQMSRRIVDQVNALRETDSLRRQLIANVSHDLRTPLASLRGYLDTLRIKQGQLSDDERRDYLDVATQSAERLERRIGDLFELAKLEATQSRPEVEPFPLPELVHDVVRKFELEAKKRGVTLRVSASPALPFALAEIGLIERALDNLIDNALRHTHRGGEVAIELGTHDDLISVRLIDTGEGIAEVDLPHIFDRFYQAERDSRDGGGTGLGLAIVKRILELHESTIEAHSRLGFGTTFTFLLPGSFSA
ncbi:MAG: HAMP domain-containing protein [bacterium]|nr:HAMP domain-containing protein [bacterium]